MHFQYSLLKNCRKNEGNLGIDKFYGENINAKKLFDVNQHSVDDFEAETNGKTKEEIKTILFQLFIENGSEDHINSYWKTGESQ